MPTGVDLGPPMTQELDRLSETSDGSDLDRAMGQGQLDQIDQQLAVV
jgi:hypothetical protein